MKAVLQLTDLHIYEDANRTQLPIDTKLSFRGVLQAAINQYDDWALIVLTGDLADLAEEASYRWLAAELARVPVPVVVLPGNHDDRSLLEKYFQLPDSIALGVWYLDFLDSNEPPKNTGRLSLEELRKLDASLAQHADSPHLVLLHHPPIALDSSWMDGMGLENPERFWNTIDKHDNVAAIANGHAHQNHDTYYRGVRVLSSPSTCTQFLPRTDHFALDRRGAGFRRLELHDDGQLASVISRVASR